MEASLNLLALDIGEKRVGVAIANTITKLSSPLKTLINSENLNRDIEDLINEHKINLLIIGLPRSLDGSDTQQTKYVREFADKFSINLDIPFYFEDEALSSIRAKKLLDEGSSKYKKEDIDALAACFILDDFIVNNKEVVDG